MDFFAHLLWTFIFFYQLDPKFFLLTEFFGVIPDLIPFGTFLIYDKSREEGSSLKKDSKNKLENAPNYIFTLYDLSHSFVTFGVCFLIVYIFFDKLALVLVPWAMHILFDIFSHSKPMDAFQTKFLYPISQFSFKGYSWQNRKFIIINYIAIIIGLIIRIFFFGNCHINLSE